MMQKEKQMGYFLKWVAIQLEMVVRYDMTPTPTCHDPLFRSCVFFLKNVPMLNNKHLIPLSLESWVETMLASPVTNAPLYIFMTAHKTTTTSSPEHQHHKISHNTENNKPLISKSIA